MGEGVWNVTRTWVGGEADNLGASKAITVVTLRANEEGRGICRGVPPSLKTSEVYVLFVSFKKRDSRVLARVCVRGLREGGKLGPTHTDGATAQTGSNETPEVGIWAVKAYPTLRQVLLFVCVRCRGMVRHVVLYDRNETATVCLRLCVCCVHVSAVRAAVVALRATCENPRRGGRPPTGVTPVGKRSGRKRRVRFKVQTGTNVGARSEP